MNDFVSNFKELINLYIFNEIEIQNEFDKKFYSENTIIIPSINQNLLDNKFHLLNQIIEQKNHFTTTNILLQIIFDHIITTKINLILHELFNNDVFILNIVYDLYNNIFYEKKINVTNFIEIKNINFSIFDDIIFCDIIKNCNFSYNFDNNSSPFIYFNIIFEKSKI